MANPLLAYWLHILGRDGASPGRARRKVPDTSVAQESIAIFLIMRRMRTPLIVLIVIFAVSVVGLTLILPGCRGSAWRMGFFDAFYVMSYTASTIGFGEIPYPFTYGQRLWVTIAIYLTVIGWAYAIGSLLALLQDRAFRQALALQLFRRKVARLREPFLLIAGYGRSGKLLGRRSTRSVVASSCWTSPTYVSTISSSAATTPMSPASSVTPAIRDGCKTPACITLVRRVLALTDDDEANLSVSMTAALLRPDLPVIARSTSPAISERMRAFGTPIVVNPFDSFGNRLRLELHAPASYQLMNWLEWTGRPAATRAAAEEVGGFSAGTAGSGER